MKRSILISILVFVFLLMFVPVRANALTVSDGIMFGAKKTPTVTSTGDIKDWNSQYNQSQNCDSLLGNPSDENSVAWLLNKILTYAMVIGMLLVVVLSSIDFLKVIAKSDDEAMAKAWKKLFLRLIFAGLLLFVPTLTATMLDIFGLTSDSNCAIVQQG